VSASRHDRRLAGLDCGRRREQSLVAALPSGHRSVLEISARTTSKAAHPASHEPVGADIIKHQRQMQRHSLTWCRKIHTCKVKVSRWLVWRGGTSVCHINEVRLRRAQLVGIGDNLWCGGSTIPVLIQVTQAHSAWPSLRG